MGRKKLDREVEREGERTPVLWRARRKCEVAFHHRDETVMSGGDGARPPRASPLRLSITCLSLRLGPLITVSVPRQWERAIPLVRKVVMVRPDGHRAVIYVTGRAATTES